MAIGAAQMRAGIEIALGIVEIVACRGIPALDGADHFGTEQDVVCRNDASHEFDTGLMIHASVKEDVVEEFLHRTLLLFERETAIATPVEGHSAAAVRDDEAQRGEVLEEIREEKLHEG